MFYDEGRYRATGHPHIVYDGIDLNDYFEVVSLGGSVLPTVEAVTATVPNKAGQHYYGRRVGARTVTFRLMALAEESDPASVMQAWRDLAPFLNKDEPRPLYIDDEMYLNAVLTGETALEFYGDRGAVEVTFTAFDPYFHGRNHEIALAAGDTSFRVVSLAEVWPYITVTGARAPLRVQNKDTAEEVRVPAVGSAKIEIDMENGKVYSNGNYVPADMQYTDFFSLPPEADVTIWLESGSGTLTYEERAL